MNEVKIYMSDPSLTTDSEATVLETVKLMRDHKVGSILIMENERSIGIFTETDLLRKVVAEEKDLGNVKISAVMSTPVITIDPEASLVKAFMIMQQKRVRHLVVTEKTKTVGVISIKDIANYYVNKFGNNSEKTGESEEES